MELYLRKKIYLPKNIYKQEENYVCDIYSYIIDKDKVYIRLKQKNISKLLKEFEIFEENSNKLYFLIIYDSIKDKDCERGYNLIKKIIEIKNKIYIDKNEINPIFYFEIVKENINLNG